ncbi:GNAT family N-acetyltransferase [Pseudomonas fluorescens]|uniref:GNAT family N-acetyltransferase n=1 Tax=Pseudomonas fluorescens TaxID=294 RepID=UPI00099914CB|nr:GNAT family N-acetyltransferase [Pseudomonas fluorescens]
MTVMTDPTVGMNNLQRAITKNNVVLTKGEIYPDLQMLVDHPAPGEVRVTYAKVLHGRIRGYVVFVKAQPFEGVPCFSIGYAVPEKFRKHGVGTEVVEKGIRELRNGMARNGLRQFYIEAIVDKNNIASQRLAVKVIAMEADRNVIEKESGKPAVVYMRLIKE